MQQPEIELMSKAFIAAAGAALIALGASGLAWSEHDDDDGDRKGHREGKGLMARGDLARVTNAHYRAECGGCHFAYQPGLLPAASWAQVMGTLDNHFGDDATLDPAVTAELLTYLEGNAADRNDRVRSRAFAARPIQGEGPPRITQTAYFQRKHDEVPVRYVKNNPKVGSFGNGQACHRGADTGDFSEDQVNIPGVGRFED
jgi:hypothetical protein